LVCGVLCVLLYRRRRAGPSLPEMVNPENPRLLKTADDLVDPVVYNGVRCMSYGWSPRGKSSAMLRGPMVSGVVTQLARGTDWGVLDVLVIDMPPGTGDIHITMGQQVEMTAAVVVTTPHRLSVVDVEKGVELLGALNVPTIALAENMAYFDADDGTRYPIFGQPVSEALAARYGIPHAIQFGISPVHADAVDAGVPFVMTGDHDGDGGDDESCGSSSAAALAAAAAAVEPYRELAAAVMKELAALDEEGGSAVRPSVSFDPYAGLAIREGTKSGSVPAHILRATCPLETAPSSVPLDLGVSSITPKGNYAVEVVWSDTHASIFPYKHIWDLADQMQ